MMSRVLLEPKRVQEEVGPRCMQRHEEFAPNPKIALNLAVCRLHEVTPWSYHCNGTLISH